MSPTDVSPTDVSPRQTSLGLCVPWTMCPLNDAAHGRCVLYRCDLTLNRIKVLVKISQNDSPKYIFVYSMPVCAYQPNLTQQKVRESQCSRTHRSGMRCPREHSRLFVRGHTGRGRDNIAPWKPVLRIRDVNPGSRIVIFTHPGSRIQKQQQKRRVKKICCHTFFVATNFT
jgi:hypothetical protein